MQPKKFKEADNTAVFTTKFVLNEGKEITLVYHDEDDGAWQFFSDDKFDDFENVAKIVGLSEIIDMDNSLLDLADLQEGYFAQRRSKGEKWIIKENRR